MKKIVSVVLALLMMFTFVSCAKEDPNAPKGMKNVAKDDDPYYFYVPQSWGTSKGVVGAYYSNADPSNISIMAYGGDDYKDTAEYWKEYKKSCESNFDEFEVVKENESTLLSGRNAVSFVYKMTSDGVKYQFKQVVTTYSNLMYVLTYTSTIDRYEAHLDEIDAIISAFKFK